MTVYYGNCTAVSNVFIDKVLPETSLISVALYLILERHPELIAGFHKDRVHYNEIMTKTGMCRASVDKAWKDLKAAGMFPVHNPESVPTADTKQPKMCLDQTRKPVVKKAKGRPRKAS